MTPLSRFIPNSRLKSLYLHSPLWLQSLHARVPYRLRAGRVFRETARLIDQTELADPEEYKLIQGRLLCRLIEHAVANTPFYREYASRANLRPEDVREPADLAKLPIVSKALMRERESDFWTLAGDQEPWYWDNTGGSSGVPFRFRKSNRMYPIELAHMLAQWERVGYSPRARKITLRGHVLSAQRGAKPWRYNPIYGELQLSSFHLDAQTLERMWPEIHRFRPTFIHGYPSSVCLFLQVMVDCGWRLPAPIRAVLCGSEPLYDHQRDFVQRTLGCRAYSWYGQSECVILAGECERASSYHSFPLYGIVELIDEEGHPITTPGREGEIVGTSLHNRAMPFIRYRTGDRGVFEARDRCLCGRHHVRLKNVVGRSQDFVYTKHGRAIPVTAFVFGQHFQAFAHIRGMQLFQDEPGIVVVRVRRGPRYSPDDEKELRTKLESTVDREILIRFDYGDSLQTTQAGKVPFVLQHVRHRGSASDRLPPHTNQGASNGETTGSESA